MLKLMEFLGYYIYRAYIIFNLFSNFITFWNIFNAPLTGLSWQTKIFRPEDLKPGLFSIHRFQPKRCEIDFAKLCNDLKLCKVSHIIVEGAIVRGRGMCSMFQSFQLTYHAHQGKA